MIVLVNFQWGRPGLYLNLILTLDDVVVINLFSAGVLLPLRPTIKSLQYPDDCEISEEKIDFYHPASLAVSFS